MPKGENKVSACSCEMHWGKRVGFVVITSFVVGALGGIFGANLFGINIPGAQIFQENKTYKITEQSTYGRLGQKMGRVCFGELCFSVEIADTAAKRAKGLMNRKSLAADSGMLFLFPDEGRHSFWMRNTLIPLDIIWLDKDKKVVFLKEGAEPCKEEICETFKPDKTALYVLEINAGKVKEIGLKIDDSMTFNWDVN